MEQAWCDSIVKLEVDQAKRLQQRPSDESEPETKRKQAGHVPQKA